MGTLADTGLGCEISCTQPVGSQPTLSTTFSPHVQHAGAPRALRRSVREGTVLVCGVYLLSPLFQTLTGTVSNDTIAFLVCFSLLLHLFLHDYRCSALSCQSLCAMRRRPQSAVVK